MMMFSSFNVAILQNIIVKFDVRSGLGTSKVCSGYVPLAVTAEALAEHAKAAITSWLYHSLHSLTNSDESAESNDIIFLSSFLNSVSMGHPIRRFCSGCESPSWLCALVSSATRRYPQPPRASPVPGAVPSCGLAGRPAGEAETRFLTKTGLLNTRKPPGTCLSGCGSSPGCRQV